MAINNSRRLSTINIQSEPIDNDNDIMGDNDDVSFESVSIKLQEPDNPSSDPLSDKKTVSLTSATKKRTTRRKQKATSYNIYKKVPASSISRTVPAVSSASLTPKTLSIFRLYTPPRKDIKAESTADSIDIGSMTGAERFLLENSITNLRPELIASFDWMPARYSSGRKGLIESMLDFRWTMRMLQVENVEETIKKLKEEDVGELYSKLEQEYDYLVGMEEQWLDWRERILDVLDNARDALDIKDNSSRLRTSTARIYSGKSPSGTDVGQDITLRSLFINSLGFSEEGYDRFCNSKIYGQLVYDLFSACTKHSPLLVTDKGTARKKDVSSTVINPQTVPKSKAYKFTVNTPGNKDLGAETSTSKQRKFDATQYKDYSRFLSTLPADDSDKIKVLTTAVSNEMNVSSGIGYLTGTSLGKRFNVDITNPFVYPFGRVRSNILEDGWPAGSLSSFVLLDDDKGQLTLPFETRDFSDESGNTAIAGSTALVDGIMRFGTLSDGLDFEPYYNFGKDINRTTKDVTEYIQSILNLDDSDENLYARRLFLDILSKFRYCINGTSNSSNRNEQQLIIAALMSLSRENPKLRHTLLRFVFEIRDARDQLIADTGSEEFLEADADNPRPRPPDPKINLTKIGGFTTWQPVTADWIQKTYNISANTAINLVRSSSSFGELATQATQARQEAARERRKNYYRLASKWQKTSMWVSILSRKTMDSQRRPPSETNTRSIVKLRSGGLISAMKKSAHGPTSYYSPFFYIIKIARELQETAVDLANRDSAGGTYMTGARLTKYNGWDENGLITMIFEVFSLLYSRFVSAELIRHNEQFYVKYFAEKNERTLEAIHDVLSLSTNKDPVTRAEQVKARESQAKQNDEMILTKDMLEGKLSVIDALQSASNSSSSDAIFSDIQSFVTSFEKEVEFKNMALSHLEAIGYHLDRNAETVKTFFNTSIEDFSTSGEDRYQKVGINSITNRIRRYMAFKSQTQFGRDLLRSITPHQLALQRVAAKKLMRKDDDPSYLSSDAIIEAEEMTALKSFLNTPQMRGISGGNIRIISVGIPTDMIDVLQNPPYVLGKKDNSELSAAKNVFEIHVHKRDLEFEDIVFKPKKFVYDRSIFLMPDAFRNVLPSTGTSSRKKERKWGFDEMVKATEFTVANTRGLYPKSAIQVYQQPSYSEIPEVKKVDIVRNHISNRLLHIYYRLLLGMSVDENTFLRNPEWGQLMVDNSASTMLQLGQTNSSTEYFLDTETVPAGNLLLPTTIQGDSRVRVATFKDAEVFTRPSFSRLASLARQTRLEVMGDFQSTNYAKKDRWTQTSIKKAMTSQVFHKMGPVKILKKQKKIAKKQAVSKALSGVNTSHLKGMIRANPKYNFAMTMTKNLANWNASIRSFNISQDAHRALAIANNAKLTSFQNETERHLRNRFYRKRPRLSAENMQHFRMICSSRILGPRIMINQVLSPRTFDRVIMLPVDPDDFEIDMVETSNILNGKSSADRKEFMEMTEEVQADDGRMIRKLKPRRRSENYSSFNDFFVTISTLTTSGNT